MNVEFQTTSETSARFLPAVRYRKATIMADVPTGMARTIIAQYAPAEHTRDYPSITAWKERPAQERLFVPSRTSIISRICNNTLREVLSTLYVALAEAYLLSHPHSDPARRRRIHQYESNLRRELSGLAFQNANNENESLAHAENFLGQLHDITSQAHHDIIPLREHDEHALHATPSAANADNILAGMQFLIYNQGTDLQTYQIFRALYIPQPPALSTYTRNVTARPQQVVRAFQIDVQFEAKENAPEHEHTTSECGICWDSMAPHTSCTTNCNHHFCVSCITEQTKVAKTDLVRRVRQNEYVPRRERTPKLTCAMCRTQVNTLTTHADRDDAKFLELGLVLQSVSSVTRPGAAAHTDHNPEFTDALSLLNQLNDLDDDPNDDLGRMVSLQ